jgi:hypothetical protein
LELEEQCQRAAAVAGGKTKDQQFNDARVFEVEKRKVVVEVCLDED